LTEFSTFHSHLKNKVIFGQKINFANDVTCDASSIHNQDF